MKRLVLISGISGAGKSTASNMLEDMGFTCIDQYPAELLPDLLELIKTDESFRYDNTVNATAEDGSLFAINFMEGGPTKSQLKTTGENYKAMVHALDQEATIGEPVVDGNVVYLKSTVDGRGRIDYTMLKEDRVGVMGSITCPQEQTDNWEKQLFPILKTVVFK